MISALIGAIIAGAVLGVIARLILPGRQNIPWWATIGAGMVAAFVGGVIATWLGVGDTNGVDWIRLLIQVVLAIIAVALVAGFMGREGRGRVTSRR